jgi:hypothetical protein
MTHSSNAREWSPDRIGSCNCIPISTFVSMAQILPEIKGTSRCCNVATVADFLEDVRGHIIQPAFSRIKTNHLYCPPAIEDICLQIGHLGIGLVPGPPLGPGSSRTS